VVDLYHRLEADRIVAEVNQGGDMVEAIIRQQDASVPVEKVWANRGKLLRAEPVAALYEQGRVRHVGAFPALEDEMCDFSLGGLSSGRSPDRVDALVWALSALMLTRDGKPRVRGM
jgi:phage terminase large subunit-like protein